MSHRLTRLLVDGSPSELPCERRCVESSFGIKEKLNAAVRSDASGAADFRKFNAVIDVVFNEKRGGPPNVHLWSVVEKPRVDIDF